MNKKTQDLKEILFKLIHDLHSSPETYVRNPGHDFLRNRKLPFEKVGMEGAALTNEFLRQFGCSINNASSAAFVQQRAKLLPTAFENLFHDFVHKTSDDNLFKGYRLLAVDGSDVQIPTSFNIKVLSTNSPRSLIDFLRIAKASSCF